MKLPPIPILAALLLASGLLVASPPTEAPNETLSRNSGSIVYRGSNPGEIMLSWWGYEAHFYFVEHSVDLVSWSYFPLYEEGVGAALTLGFEEETDRRFWRLSYSDDPESALLSTDYNGIGLSAWDQIQLGYNPFDWVDTDANALHDAWELHYFALIGVDLEADPEGDGQTNLQEFQSGTNPAHPDHPAVSLSLLTPLR